MILFKVTVSCCLGATLNNLAQDSAGHTKQFLADEDSLQVSAQV